LEKIDEKSPSLLTSDDVSVIKHVDYSSKYGLGYILSNGCYGVYFNDSSKINFDPQSEEITFIPKPDETKEDIGTLKYTPTTLPKSKDLQKKYSLLEHFKYYLDAEVKNKSLTPVQPGKLVFMKQWLKTKHAVMFRLSNKVFQVDFLDQSQILLNTDTKLVVYTNKKGDRSVHTLNEALNTTES
jgi:polo-like kinase 1